MGPLKDQQPPGAGGSRRARAFPGDAEQGRSREQLAPRGFHAASPRPRPAPAQRPLPFPRGRRRQSPSPRWGRPSHPAPAPSLARGPGSPRAAPRASHGPPRAPGGAAPGVPSTDSGDRPPENAAPRSPARITTHSERSRTAAFRGSPTAEPRRAAPAPHRPAARLPAKRPRPRRGPKSPARLRGPRRRRRRRMRSPFCPPPWPLPPGLAGARSAGPGPAPRSPLPAAPQLPRRRRGAGAGRGRSALPRGPAEEWGEGGGSALSPALNNKGRPRGRRAAEPPPLPSGAGSVSELGEWGRRGMSAGCPSARALPRGYGTGSSRAGESAAAGRRLCFSVEKRFSSSTWEAQKKPKQLRSHSSNSLKANPKQGQGKASRHRNAAGPAQKVPSPGEKMLRGAGRGG